MIPGHVHQRFPHCPQRTRSSRRSITSLLGTRVRPGCLSRRAPWPAATFSTRFPAWASWYGTPRTGSHGQWKWTEHLRFPHVQTALKHIFNFRGAPDELRVQRILSKLASSGTKIPPDFKKSFAQAECLFFHHIIYNPHKPACQFLVDQTHANCFPDMFQLACESLGVTATDGSSTIEIDALDDLCAAVNLSTSFLGAVPTLDLVQQLYKGMVSSRSLQKLPSSDHPAPVDAQPVQSATSSPPIRTEARPGGAFRTTVVFQATARTARHQQQPDQARVRKPVALGSMLQGLQQTISAAQSMNSSSQVAHSPPPKGTASSRGASSLAETLPDRPVESSPIQVTAMKDLLTKLARKRSIDEQPEESNDSPFKPTKKTRLLEHSATKPSPPVKSKSVVSNPKKPPTRRGNTLLSFFQRVER